MAGPGLILTLAKVAAVLAPIVVAVICWLAWRSRRRRLAISLALIGLAGWGLGVWAFLIEPSNLVVREVAIRSATWTGPPLRIGVISDTHVAAPHTDVARIERVVARMNAERPDVVVLLGDYAGGHEPAGLRARPEQSEILRGVTAFGGLDAPLGVVGVLGNHDSWYDEAAIATALRSAGVKVVENRAVAIDRPGGAFWIAGIADLDSKRIRPSVPQALSAVPANAPVVVITHWPEPFAEVPSRVALTLAGHTHCGQVNLPIFGRLVHASHASRRWGCGVYDDAGRTLFVTSGVGVSILPVRFRAPPEIAIVTLSGPNAEGLSAP